ncbi:thaumatin family domain-containing protein [Ditylenchus destructor]|uniref:Thaumatin family domain-containing protein n=1 Tax=Ditylenchus destructor TaxID=166010 RepID=A0AAD4N190_9BILA|nr:thaumatin family domain-containing protein [Ditylenchus destructor]
MKDSGIDLANGSSNPEEVAVIPHHFSTLPMEVLDTIFQFLSPDDSINIMLTLKQNDEELKQKDEELKQKDEELKQQAEELEKKDKQLIVLVILSVILAVIVLAPLRFQFPSVAGLCGTGGAQCCTGGPEKCPPSAFTPEKKKQYDEMKPNIKGNGAGGAPPASLVEFTLAKDKSGQDTYDTSYVDGYNEMTIMKPIEGTYDPAAKKPAEDNFCTTDGECKEDLKTAASTPKELKKPSETAPTVSSP